MRAASLKVEWSRLKGLDDHHRRGYDLQAFIGNLFRRAHFTVTPNPGAGGRRQVDLLAKRGDECYLVETKWWTKPLDIDAVDSLRTRLASTPPDVVGLLVSPSGFTKSAVTQVEERADRPILLMRGEELDRIVDWDGDFMATLQQKRNTMLTHAKVIWVGSRQPAKRREKKATLPSSLEAIVSKDGSRATWLKCGGDFGRFVFVPELPEIDWVPGSGHGVTLDVGSETTDEKGLLALLHELSNRGWVSPHARWSIQQVDTNWHRFGADSFLVVLKDWKTRYKDLASVHHTEEFCFFDVCDDLGFYTLTGQVSADPRRIVWRASLSLQLSGVPLNTGPLREICEFVDPASTLYLRPRGVESVTRHQVIRDESAPLEVLGFVTADHDLEPDPREREWAVGIVVKNPFRRGADGRTVHPDWWPATAADSELVICALRSWHPITRPKKKYRLWSTEWAWTSDGLVFRPLADWDDVRAPRERRPTVRADRQ